MHDQPSITNRPWIAGIGVFFLVLGVRWCLIGLFGVDVPFWDQWSMEAWKLYQPHLTGTLKFSDLFQSHNEHRLALSNTLNLALFIINQRWSPLLTMAIQSIIPALTAGLLATWHLRDAGKRRPSRLSLCLIALIFLSPINSENLLWGFQSQVYFLAFFAVVAIRRASVGKRPIDVVIALICCGLASLSQAGGFTVAFVCGLIWLNKGVFHINNRWLNFLLCAAGFAIAYGLSLLVVEVPGHRIFEAKTVWDFMQSLLKNLGWPFGIFGVLLTWVPAGLIVLRAILRRKVFTEREVYPLALFVWTGGLCLAISRMRGAGGVGPANRYGDMLALIYPATLFVLDYFEPNQRTGIQNCWRGGIKLALLILFWVASFHCLDYLAGDRDKRLGFVEKLRESLRTEGWKSGSGLGVLAAAKPNVDLPYPSADLVWNTMNAKPIMYFLPTPFCQAARAKPLGRDVIGRNVYDGVPRRIEGPAMGSFIGGDAWQGVMESEPIDVEGRSIDLLLAGYLYPKTLEIDVIFEPSGETTTLSEGPVFGSGAGETWRRERVRLPAGTERIRIVLRDQCADAAGWAGVAGITYPARLEFLNRHWLDLGAALALLGIFLSMWVVIALSNSKTSEA